MSRQDAPIKIFSSYSSADETYRRELEEHLAGLKRAGVVATWNFRQIEAGDDWRHAINVNLNDADVILLLVSASFLASDYCWDIEMTRALARHESGEAVVIPVVVRDCDWHAAPFSKLQALPEGGKAVTRWRPRDRAWSSVAAGIRRKVESLRASPKRDNSLTPAARSDSPRPAVNAPSEKTVSETLQADNARPELLAEFERKAAPPRAVVTKTYQRLRHFSIRLYVRNAPRNAATARYKLHPTFRPQVRDVVRDEHDDFTLWIETYGDFEIVVTFLAGGGTIVGKASQYLTQALEQHYRDAMEDQIAHAIDEVREN